MKTSKYIYSFMLAVALAFAGCSDFLDSEDNSNIAGDNFYQTEDDFRAATAPLYNKVWFDFNDKFYYGLGDGRGFNLCATTSNYIYPFADLTETGLTGPLVSAWGSLYNIVQQTNKIINGIKGNSSNSEEVKNPYIAEARFMRGVAYSYLAMLWGNVIINEDTDELVANPIVNTSPVSDVYEFAMRDLEFAAKYLPEVSSAAGVCDQEIQCLLSDLKAHEGAASMVLSFLCEAVLAAQVTIMGNVQAECLHNCLSRLEICHISLVNILRIQLLCVDQLLNLVQGLFYIFSRVGFGKLSLCILSCGFRNLHRGHHLSDDRL